jgi:hypothetical protein
MSVMSSRLTLLLIISLFLVPAAVQGGMSMAADAMCNPVIPACKCGEVMTPKGCKMKGPQFNKFMCPVGICFDTPPGGKVDGTCVAPNNCEGKQTEKGGIGDAKGFGDMMKGMMEKMMEMMKKEGGDSPPPPPPPPTDASQQCPGGKYMVTTPSADPCAQYTPPNSNALLDPNGTLGSSNNILSNLLSSLTGGAGAEDVLDETLDEEEGEGEGETESVSDKVLSNVGTGEEGTTGSTTTDSTGTLADKKVRHQNF